MSREIYIDNLGLEHEISGTVSGASSLPYYNGTSGLSATTVQGAVDELASEKADRSTTYTKTEVDTALALKANQSTTYTKTEVDEKLLYINTINNVPIASFNDGGDNIPLKSLIANITAVQSGSGTPSPSNIRSISGWSECNLVGCGINVFDEVMELGYITSGTGQNNNSSQLNLRSKNYIPVKSGNQYYLKSSVGLVYCPIFFYDKDKNYVSETLQQIWNNTITIPNNVCYMRFYMHDSYDTSYKNDISINYPSTDMAYHPYKGTTHTIPFGQTVYGGTLDVIKGVLTVTHGIVDLGTLSYTQNNHQTFGTYYYANVQPLGLKRQSDYTQAYNNICEKYAVVGRNANDFVDFTMTFDGNNATVLQVQVKNSNCADATAMQTALNGVHLVYELATPTTIYLTPTQVKTLLGLNNIFADTGDISLSYFTQNANAINDIAESNTRTALNTDVPKTDLTDIFVTGTKNNTGSTISAGTYFYVNNQLALCKSAISANADLTLNTNYELVTAGALNKLAIKTTTVSGTTDSTGNITSDLAPTNKMILSAAKQRLAGGNQDLAYVSYCYNSGQTKFVFHLTNNDGTIYANKSVIIDVFYIDI